MTAPIIKRKHGRLADETGMVLLVVLAVISVLLVAGLELARRTGDSALASIRKTDRVLAQERAMAGIHLAMAVLEEDADTTTIDSIQENWARPEKLAQVVEAMGYDSESLVLEIEDELGKLQINALIKGYPGREQNADQYKIWKRFFDPLVQEPQDLINCILDWLDDRDDDTVSGISGAESDYYLSLDPPYACANGPFNHISELFRVKGITRELFSPKPEDDTEEGLGKIVPEKVITVQGLNMDAPVQGKYHFPGKVNINTAPEPVIRALLPMELQDFARILTAYREDRGEDGVFFINPLDKGWVSRVVDLPKNREFQTIVRYDTTLFRVRITAKVNQTQSQISALIHREQDKLSGKWSCRLLQVTKET